MFALDFNSAVTVKILGIATTVLAEGLIVTNVAKLLANNPVFGSRFSNFCVKY